MSMRRLGVFGSPRVAPRVVPVAAPSLSAARAPARGALVIVAAEKKPQKMDSAVKRAKLSEERRMRNKARKSAIATRTKKVCVCPDLRPECGIGSRVSDHRILSLDEAFMAPQHMLLGTASCGTETADVAGASSKSAVT